MLQGSALRDFETFKAKTDDRIKDYINFFRQYVPIEESKWFDSTLNQLVEVYTVNDGESMLLFYNEVQLILKLNYDYNQAYA